MKQLKWAFTLIELILYVVFVSIIWLASFSIISQFFGLNKILYSYKEFKIDYLDFDKDLIDLITSDYQYYTWWNKLVLTGTDLIWFACSWNVLKADFDSTWNITSVLKEYKYLPCNSLSWYYQSGINLDLNLKFKWTWLILHYYFK